MTLLLLYAALAIGVSFLCSLLEASLLSVPASHVEALRERKSKTGALLDEMKQSIDRPLAAILTLNTIAHTVGAAGVGAQAAVVFGSAAVGIASAVMTLLILIVSEIIPKTLGVVYAKPLAPMTAWTARGMIILCYPLIIALEWVNRMLGYKRSRDVVSRAELVSMIRLGREGGALDRREFSIVSNMLALSKVTLRSILTPRIVMLALPETLKVGDVIKERSPLPFSRIPVYRDSIDDIIGYVGRFDIHNAYSEGRTEIPLKELVKPLHVMPEQATVADALELMLREALHIILIVNEYGAVEGIVTLEDALESLLGEEIIDETDPAVDMQEVARKRRKRTRRRVLGEAAADYAEPTDEPPGGEKTA